MITNQHPIPFEIIIGNCMMKSLEMVTSGHGWSGIRYRFTSVYDAKTFTARSMSILRLWLVENYGGSILDNVRHYYPDYAERFKFEWDEARINSEVSKQ